LPVELQFQRMRSYCEHTCRLTSWSDHQASGILFQLTAAKKPARFQSQSAPINIITNE
jgi:hypothetical protein